MKRSNGFGHPLLCNLLFLMGLWVLGACGQRGEDSAGITNTGNTNTIVGRVQGDGAAAASGNLSGVMVYLSRDSVHYVDSCRTNAEGYFEFSDVETGTWVVTVAYKTMSGSWQAILTSTQSSAAVLFIVQETGITAQTVVPSSSSSYSSSSSSSPKSLSVAASVWCETAGNCGTFADARDGQAYNWTLINGTKWMAENLNYLPENGFAVCYGDVEENCGLYGRLYRWSTAMAIDPSYDSSAWGGASGTWQGICPLGWHVPSYAEWTALADYVVANHVDTSVHVAKDLGATSNLWLLSVNEGVDLYGFSALPVGMFIPTELGYDLQGYISIGEGASWWSASEHATSPSSTKVWAISWLVYAEGNSGYPYGNFSSSREYGESLRCVEDPL